MWRNLRNCQEHYDRRVKLTGVEVKLLKTAENWATRKCRERWEHYLSIVPPADRTPAHDGDLGRRRDKLHQGVRKAKRSLAFQLRTEKVGFAAFFHTRRVPDVISPVCQRSQRHSDLKNLTIFCPKQAPKRRGLDERLEHSDIKKY